MAATFFKRIHARVTRNRLTSVFFLFGFFHCLAQGIIQSLLFTIDSEYYSLLNDITQTAGIPAPNHTNLVFADGGYQLELCNYIPHSPEVCTDIFDSTKDIVAPDNLTIEIDAIQRGGIITHFLNQENFTIQRDPTHQQVIFEGQGFNTVNLNSTCTSILLYPAQHLENSRREDLAFVLLQFWLFGISVLAMMYDSVPHVLTVFITRITLTAWSIYALWRTEWQSSVFNEMIETSGTPCSIAIFGQYFSTRVLYEIPDLILNCTALGISAYLSWTLLRTYNAEAFTTVGAPKTITRMYKYFLALQVCLQLEVFVLFTATGLWADQLFNTYIRAISTHSHAQVYEALILSYGILIAPWLLMAWYGIRYEKRKITIAFIAGAFVLLTAGALMFTSDVYTWTYYSWPCFGCFITASFLLFVATIVLGIVCLKNFGKGLSQYLYAESNLSSSNFASEVFERDVESTYVDDEKLKASGLHADFTTHYLPTLGLTSSRDSYLDSLSER